MFRNCYEASARLFVTGSALCIDLYVRTYVRTYVRVYIYIYTRTSVDLRVADKMAARNQYKKQIYIANEAELSV